MDCSSGLVECGDSLGHPLLNLGICIPLPFMPSASVSLMHIHPQDGRSQCGTRQEELAPPRAAQVDAGGPLLSPIQMAPARNRTTRTRGFS